MAKAMQQLFQTAGEPASPLLQVLRLQRSLQSTLQPLCSRNFLPKANHQASIPLFNHSGNRTLSMKPSLFRSFATSPFPYPTTITCSCSKTSSPLSLQCRAPGAAAAAGAVKHRFYSNSGGQQISTSLQRVGNNDNRGGSVVISNSSSRANSGRAAAVFPKAISHKAVPFGIGEASAEEAVRQNNQELAFFCPVAWQDRRNMRQTAAYDIFLSLLENKAYFISPFASSNDPRSFVSFPSWHVITFSSAPAFFALNRHIQYFSSLSQFDLPSSLSFSAPCMPNPLATLLLQTQTTARRQLRRNRVPFSCPYYTSFSPPGRALSTPVESLTPPHSFFFSSSSNSNGKDSGSSHTTTTEKSDSSGTTTTTREGPYTAAAPYQKQQQQQRTSTTSSYLTRRSSSSSSRAWWPFAFSGLLSLLSRLFTSFGSAIFRGTKTFFRYLRLFLMNPMIVKKWWKKGKESAVHAWRWTVTGFSLFYANVRVSYQLLKKKILGHPLRYNEHKLLVRTTADALKLIPFSLMIVIPLGELLLPVVLRLFPNMLPSTFFEKQVDNAYLSRKLKAKQELAAFFQELVREHTKHIIEHESNDALKNKAKTLREFQEKLLRKDQKDVNPFLSLKEILSFAKLFKEEFVLEKLDIQTLQVMCKLLGIQPYSLQSHVVLQLRYHLNNIQREDREFMWEGVEALSHDELVEACKDRAMMFHSISDEDMREQMRQWLEISSHKDIPPLLLLWCRCITLTHRPIPPPTAAAPTSTTTTSTGGTTTSTTAAAPPILAALPQQKQQQQSGAQPVTGNVGGRALHAVEDAPETAAAAATTTVIAPETTVLKEKEEAAAAVPAPKTAVPLESEGLEMAPASIEKTKKDTTNLEKKEEEEEADEENEKLKAATLEAMERQVELLRAEEETLRQSVMLLQEEEAQRKQQHSTDHLLQTDEEAAIALASATHAPEAVGGEVAGVSAEERPDSGSAVVITEAQKGTKEDLQQNSQQQHPSVGGFGTAGSIGGVGGGNGAAVADIGFHATSVPVAPGSSDLSNKDVVNAAATAAAAAAAAAASSVAASSAVVIEDASLNELARVRIGREMLQRRARRMELELALLRKLSDMQHEQQEQAFGALTRTLQAAHACRKTQEALQQLQKLQQQQQQQAPHAEEQLEQHLEAERSHNLLVANEEAAAENKRVTAALQAAAADFPQRVSELEICVEEMIKKFSDGVKQVEQLMRDAKRLQMNDDDALFYPEDHSDNDEGYSLTLSNDAKLASTSSFSPFSQSFSEGKGHRSDMPAAAASAAEEAAAAAVAAAAAAESQTAAPTNKPLQSSSAA